MLFSCMRGSIERVRRRTEAGTPIHRHVPSGRTGDTMKRAIRSTPLPLDRTAAITAVCALCACAALAVSPRAHAATLADAVASGQAGGNATELDLLALPLDPQTQKVGAHKEVRQIPHAGGKRRG